MLPKIEIEPEYIVQESGTSDGTQIKYCKDDKWYKIDRYGGEGQVEELVSEILALSNLSSDNYVKYSQVIINEENGCMSDNFLQAGESFITFYRLYSNIQGGDLAVVTSKMDYDEAIEYVLEFMDRNVKVDLREYLANIFALDALILNEDRHFNNFGLIYDGNIFRPAPIFDNGKSLFVGNKRYNPKLSMSENKKKAFAKAFSGSFVLNNSYLKKYRSFDFDYDKIKLFLQDKITGEDTVYDRLYSLVSCLRSL